MIIEIDISTSSSEILRLRSLGYTIIFTAKGRGKVMKNKDGKIAKLVIAKSSGHGRLTKGRKYRVIYPSTNRNKYVFVLDDTNNINGYHICNFDRSDESKK